MRVKVRLFARLRDIAGAAELTRDVASGATVRTVWQELAAEFPEMASYERSISTAVMLLRSARFRGMAPMKWPMLAAGSRMRPPVKPKRSTACHIASITETSV